MVTLVTKTCRFFRSDRTYRNSSRAISITKCYNAGVVDSHQDGNRSAGGIVGSFVNNIVTIDRCYNEGRISGSGSVGGVVGRSDGLQSWSVITISNCYNNGEVNNDKGNLNAKNKSYAAGIISTYSVLSRASKPTSQTVFISLNNQSRDNIYN